MENQHRLIKTYRELSQIEIDLMNECKVLEAEYHELWEKIRLHVRNQTNQGDLAEQKRLFDSNPVRWLSLSKTNVEQGFMALVRAVAQPTTPKLERSNEA